MNRAPRTGLVLATIFALLGFAACASKGPEVETLGFLEDYAQLSPGRSGQASLIFIDSGADFSAYSAILVEPVVGWAGADGEVSDSVIALAQHFDMDLRRELAHEFEVVDEPRADALRLRAALASRGGSNSGGVSALVVEVEVLDSVSGSRVVAAVDHRAVEAAGAESVTNAWAMLIRHRLAVFREFDSAAKAREAEKAK